MVTVRQRNSTNHRGLVDNRGLLIKYYGAAENDEDEDDDAEDDDDDEDDDKDEGPLAVWSCCR